MKLEDVATIHLQKMCAAAVVINASLLSVKFIRIHTVEDLANIVMRLPVVSNLFLFLNMLTLRRTKITESLSTTLFFYCKVLQK